MIDNYFTRTKMENSNSKDGTNTSNSKSEKPQETDHELERIRLKRMQNVLRFQQQKKQENDSVQSFQNKIRTILNVILTPDAHAYLSSIETRDSTLFTKIRNMILPSHITTQIDTLLMYFNRGMLRRGVISMIDIQYIERQILGIGTKITVKKSNRESTDLSTFLRKG